MKFYLIRVTNPNGLIWAYWKGSENVIQAFEDAGIVLKDRLKFFDPVVHIQNPNPSFLVFSNECPQGK